MNTKNNNIFSLLTRISLLEFSIYLFVFFIFVLNDGVALIRFPFTPLPLGELLLTFTFIIYLIYDKEFIKIIENSKYTLPYLILFISTLCGVFINISSYGTDALRTATHVVDFSFLFIGIKFGKNIILKKIFFKIFPFTLFIGSLYMFTYSFKDSLIDLSPLVPNLTGNLVPLLFNFSNTPILSINFFAYYILKPKIPFLSFGFIISILSLFFVVFIYSKRLNYLLILFLFFIYLISINKKNIIKFFVPLFIVAMAFIFINSLDINLFSDNLKSFEFIKNNFFSGFNFFQKYTREYRNEMNYIGDTSGANLRLIWWIDGLQKLTISPFNLIFGLGQGIPLTDFVNRNGILVKELHNSYLTILLRNGLIGFIPFIYIKSNLFLSLWREFKLSSNQYVKSKYIIFIFFFSSISIFSLFQPAFEKPYWAIPYYFYWGIVLSDIYQNKIYRFKNTKSIKI